MALKEWNVAAGFLRIDWIYDQLSSTVIQSRTIEKLMAMLRVVSKKGRKIIVGCRFFSGDQERGESWIRFAGSQI